jgi:uncharacterized membrane protein SpoIIM required for sporulation
MIKVILDQIAALLIVLITGNNVSSPLSAFRSGNTSVLQSNILFQIIINNNIKFYIELALGEIFLLIPTIYVSSLIEGTIIGISGNYRIFIDKVLPEFIPETAGYVLGITVSLAICTIVLSFIEGYLRGINYNLFEKELKKNMYIITIFATASVISILIAGYI